ncbi:hypothetical protein Lal_00006660, partial [Lupinus albus]
MDLSISNALRVFHCIKVTQISFTGCINDVLCCSKSTNRGGELEMLGFCVPFLCGEKPNKSQPFGITLVKWKVRFFWQVRGKKKGKRKSERRETVFDIHIAAALNRQPRLCSSSGRAQIWTA